MGEVYRARDAKLNRDIALKVLPDLFALHRDRLARFKRGAHGSAGEEQVVDDELLRASNSSAVINLAMNTKELKEERTRCLRDVKGVVLEIGFGAGLNLPHYPPTVTKIVGVDPSETSAKLARKRIAASPVPVETIGLSAEKLPVPDGSFDSIVSTFTLCTIPDVGAALLEVQRALAPGGRFCFVEHGLAEEPQVERWQHRLNSINQRLLGGCHLTRPMATLIEGAGFEIERLEKSYMKDAPKFAGFVYRGVAKRTP